jgi:hypothetical protein
MKFTLAIKQFGKGYSHGARSGKEIRQAREANEAVEAKQAAELEAAADTALERESPFFKTWKEFTLVTLCFLFLLGITARTEYSTLAVVLFAFVWVPYARMFFVRRRKAKLRIIESLKGNKGF